MSKVTVITNNAGKIVSIGLGHLSEKTSRQSNFSGLLGGLRAGAGQKLDELDVPGDLDRLKSFEDLHERVRPHLANQ